jgi:hypothetical protein
MAACVPTGMNAGVSTTPCGVLNQPSLAGPSPDAIPGLAVRNANGVIEASLCIPLRTSLSILTLPSHDHADPVHHGGDQ